MTLYHMEPLCAEVGTASGEHIVSSTWDSVCRSTTLDAAFRLAYSIRSFSHLILCVYVPQILLPRLRSEYDRQAFHLAGVDASWR